MKDPQKTRECRRCIYFMPFETAEGAATRNPSGECRRQSPGLEQKWPQVDNDEYCGEFKEKE